MAFAGSDSLDDMTNNSRAVLRLVIFLAGATLLGCSKWPDIVNRASDIRALPSTTTAVRARGLPDEEVPELARLQQLEDLDFWGGWKVEKEKITDKGLRALSGLELPNLTTLFLGNTRKISDEGLRYIAKLKHVKTLGLINCSGLTNHGLAEVLRMSDLEHLDLRASDWVTDDTLMVLESGKGLRTIMLCGCKNVSAEGLDALRKALPLCSVHTEEVNDPSKW
jgi:hypothetical protein